MSQEDRYRQAGVDIEKGNQFVRNIQDMVKATHSGEVLGGIGGFSGLFSLNDAKSMNEPVLVSSTDGVGTKLKIAFMMDKHDTVGQDMVGMVVNDVVVCGAKPLFLLDYIATGKLELKAAQDIVAGVAKGCSLAACSLIGGETAEMPDFYAPGEYDLAGFSVGLVDKARILDGSAVKAGDVLVGLSSSGLHSNGFSLVRRIVFEEMGLSVDSKVDDLERSIGEELLEPTLIYVRQVLAVQDEFNLKAVAHITGGGLLENLPRVLPDGCRAIIKNESWPVPPIFSFLARAGKLDQTEMRRTFNSGIGMVMALPADQADQAVEKLKAMSQPAYIIGEIKEAAPAAEPVVFV